MTQLELQQSLELSAVPDTGIVDAHSNLNGIIRRIHEILLIEEKPVVHVFLAGEPGSGKSALAEHLARLFKAQEDKTLPRFKLRTSSTGGALRAGRELGLVKSPHTIDTYEDAKGLSTVIETISEIEQSGPTMVLWETVPIFRRLGKTEKSGRGPDLGSEALRRIIENNKDKNKTSKHILGIFNVTNPKVQQTAISVRGELLAIAHELQTVSEPEITQPLVKRAKYIMQGRTNKSFDWNAQNVISLAFSSASAEAVIRFREIMNQRIHEASKTGEISRLRHMSNLNNSRTRIHRQTQLYELMAKEFGFESGEYVVSLADEIAKGKLKPNKLYIARQAYTVEEIIAQYRKMHSTL